MFNVGDVIIYSVHGLSRIDDICEKTISNVTRKYYVLHPLEQSTLTISVPVDSDKVVMLEMMDQAEAEEILQSFKQPGVKWIENSKQRYSQYHDKIKAGDRMEIAQITNTLLRKELELSLDNKKMHEQDRKILEPIQHLLFQEMAMTLDTTLENISEQVNNMIKA
ncbi:CarD family transcriptional regulator [Neobacillus mesonae]|uniref:CarD family transcriptional regulator n=1 Tax=Neobacillus mesonae TaxID=1193713 RepID=UPI00203F3796|nr:CarD family transcriptional regulator [Neobacillus mesonae]MCM3567253.1 CarD family transcriptional regulator [Neobacillus mesonae]